MMIGAVVYRLRALVGDSIPLIHGHLLHGVCFQILKEFSTNLADSVHALDFKPFTASMLSFPATSGAGNGRQNISEGEHLRWRVTALQDNILQAFLSVTAGKELHIGGLVLQVEEIVADPAKEARTGVMEDQELLSQCLQMHNTNSVLFHFLSPTSFRMGATDFPLPTPSLVFGSLADKWAAAHPGTMFPEDIRRAAELVTLENWHGSSRRVFFHRQRGVNAFTGSFRFGLRGVDEDMRQSMLLLAAYADFSGVGRLTTQGLGQVRVEL